MGSLNTNHDRHYMRIQEVFLDISASTPAGVPRQEVPPCTSLPSEAYCPEVTVNPNIQLPPDAAARCQEQESDDSSD